MPSARFRPLALRDIRETSAWLDENAGQSVAERFFDSLRSTSELLAGMPLMGSPCNYAHPELKELRRWPVKDFDRWLIFYFPASQGIEIARVLHGARNLDAVFD